MTNNGTLTTMEGMQMNERETAPKLPAMTLEQIYLEIGQRVYLSEKLQCETEALIETIDKMRLAEQQEKKSP